MMVLSAAPRWLRCALPWLVPGAALALYVEAARHSPAFDAQEDARVAVLNQVVASTTTVSDQKERALAQAYWQRYPDVAAHPYFGRHGQLGLRGAREHYLLHGQREGRVWGADPSLVAPSPPPSPPLPPPPPPPPAPEIP